MPRQREFDKPHVISLRREKSELPGLRAKAARAGYRSDRELSKFLNDLIDLAFAEGLDEELQSSRGCQNTLDGVLPEGETHLLSA
jgi:hypothetical protein